MRHRIIRPNVWQWVLLSVALTACPQEITVLPDGTDAGPAAARDGGSTLGDAGAMSCGDDRIEGTEVCDGVALGGASCQSLGIGTGTLGCNTGCTDYDRSGCVVCTPQCGALECGVDPVCGITCGTCETDEACTDSGLCIQTCEPGSYVCAADGFGWQGCGLDESTGVNDVGPRVACPDQIMCDVENGSPCNRTACQVADIVFVVDRSASMAAGSTWTWMHDTLLETIDHHQSANRLGVRQFPGSMSCMGGTYVPPGFDNKTAIDNALGAPGADTSSPIAAALDGLVPTFNGRHDAQAVVILTDGAETCADAQDALDAASRLFRIGVRVFVIGLTSRADGAFLDQLARVGGTEVHRQADDAVELGAVLGEVMVSTGACRNTRARVTAGYYHACGRYPDGQLACWGRDLDGQSTPPLGQFTDIGASTDAVCAVEETGPLRCWGRDINGQITPPGGAFTQVAGGDSHFCAVRQDGRVACWGNNTAGQATPPTGTFTQVATGTFHSCGIKTDGTIECWGSPRPPTLQGKFRAIAGSWTYCGIETDGEVKCTGGMTPPAGPFVRIDVGPDHACGVRSDFTLVCWGSDGSGQSTVPAGRYADVAANNAYTCAVTEADQFVCWGEGANGQTSPPTR